MSIDIDADSGIKANERYIPFGRYLLNQHRLHSDILMLRTMKGGAISDLPTQKVRKAFIKNVEAILENRNPSYDEVAELTNDEKKLLYKLTKMANLQDKIKVPHPCDMDKDNHIIASVTLTK